MDDLQGFDVISYCLIATSFYSTYNDTNFFKTQRVNHFKIFKQKKARFQNILLRKTLRKFSDVNIQSSE